MVNHRRDSEGLFYGERRINCESIPRLRAASVRFAVEDPRRIPFVFLWRDRWERPLEMAVVCRDRRAEGTVEVIRQHDGGTWRLRVVRPAMPGGGTDFLLACPSCDRSRRYLYAWVWRGNGAVRAGWPCRLCAGLRYISEGNGRNPWGPYPRSPIDAWVLSSREQLEALWT
jgi:hypothetical protein